MPTDCKRVSLFTAHGGGPCFQDPGQSLLCLFPSGGGCITGGAGKAVLLPRLTGLGAVDACLSGSLPGTTPDVHPVLAFLHPVGAPVCVPRGCIRELISHQDCLCVKVPSGPRLAEILFSAVHRAHALASIIHSCIYWWLLCARTCFQR